MVPPDEAELTPRARAAFDALRRSFAAGLPARWAEIAAAPDAARRGAALHRLAGAAGSYQFAEIDALARRALAQVESGASTVDLDATLDRLRLAIESARA